jgi:hypothetical protein
MGGTFAWLRLSGVTKNVFSTSTSKAKQLFLKEKPKPAHLLQCDLQR